MCRPVLFSPQLKATSMLLEIVQEMYPLNKAIASVRCLSAGQLRV
jgi:hypothetical protein